MKNTRNLILIVEDDEKLRQILEDFLTANHFAVNRRLPYIMRTIISSI